MTPKRQRRLEKKRKLVQEKLGLEGLMSDVELIREGYRKAGRIVPTAKAYTAPQAHSRYAMILIWLGCADKPRKKKRERLKPDVVRPEFLESYEWRRLRMKVLKKFGARCQCCGRGAEQGVQIHVDHIKPRKKYPELALDVDNLQVLCHECNHGKGNWDETDWRPSVATAWGLN